MSLSYSLRSLHARQDLIRSCVELLKSTWPNCLAERLYQLAPDEGSAGLPHSLVLIEHQGNVADVVIGHLRLAPITYPLFPKGVYFEAGCITRPKQGFGLGKKMLHLAENYAVSTLGCKQALLTCHSSLASYFQSLSYTQHKEPSLKVVGQSILRPLDDICQWYGIEASTVDDKKECAYYDGSVFPHILMKKALRVEQL